MRAAACFHCSPVAQARGPCWARTTAAAYSPPHQQLPSNSTVTQATSVPTQGAQSLRSPNLVQLLFLQTAFYWSPGRPCVGVHDSGLRSGGRGDGPARCLISGRVQVSPDGSLSLHCGPPAWNAPKSKCFSKAECKPKVKRPSSMNSTSATPTPISRSTWNN